MLLMKQV